jgi:hypothetical protein
MKSPDLKSAILVAVAIVQAALAQTGSDEATTFPYLSLTPAKPVAGDVVTMKIMLGTASNSCAAPTFSNISFTIEQSMLTIYPPLFTVKVKFRQDSIPIGKVCPAVYNPVDYGPAFGLGALKVGSYAVVDAIDEKKTYGNFTVVEGPAPVTGKTLKGKIYDDPYPTKRMARPIPSVKVFIEAGPMPLTSAAAEPASQSAALILRDSAFTDSLGAFVFTKLSQGNFNLTCTHKEFRTITKSFFLRSDTSISLTMVSVSAFAAVQGTVTMVSPENGRVAPLEGCTVTVSKGQYLPTVGTEAWKTQILWVITDVNGKYAIDSIPITANGETWYVNAFRGAQYRDNQPVTLSNMSVMTVDFKFMLPYQNSDSVVVHGAVFRTATDKYVYRKDEPVKVRYSITNTTRTDFVYGPFNMGCEYDLAVMVIPTVTAAPQKEIYRQSDQLTVCLAAIDSIVVSAGKTVVKDFPDYYLPALTSFAPTGNKIILMVTARLRGAKYDTTAVGVPIEVRLDPTAVAGGTETMAGFTAPCDVRGGKIALQLPRAQNVSVALFRLDGKMLPGAAYSRMLQAGSHLLPFAQGKMPKGMFVVGVKGSDFQKKFNVMNVGY